MILDTKTFIEQGKGTKACSTCREIRAEKYPYSLDRDTGKYWIVDQDGEDLGIVEECPDCGKEIECGLCYGTGSITIDYHDPADPYGHGQREEICICRIGDENADMDDDS